MLSPAPDRGQRRSHPVTGGARAFGTNSSPSTGLTARVTRRASAWCRREKAQMNGGVAGARLPIASTDWRHADRARDR